MVPCSPPTNCRCSADVNGSSAKSPAFLVDYAKVIKTEPILVTGQEGQEVLAALGKVSQSVKDFLITYTNRITTK
jgi:hypothetical protein